MAESCSTSTRCWSSFLISTCNNWAISNCTICFLLWHFLALYFNHIHLGHLHATSSLLSPPQESPLLSDLPGLTSRIRFLNDSVHHRGGLVKTFASLICRCPSDRGPVVILARTNTSVIAEPITGSGGSNGVISFTLDIGSRVSRDIINPYTLAISYFFPPLFFFYYIKCDGICQGLKGVRNRFSVLH